MTSFSIGKWRYENSIPNRPCYTLATAFPVVVCLQHANHPTRENNIYIYVFDKTLSNIYIIKVMMWNCRRHPPPADISRPVSWAPALGKPDGGINRER